MIRTALATPSGPQPDGALGCGAGFWSMNRSEGVPTDIFAAFGNRGQYVVIVPSRRVVIVRRGEDPPGSGFDIAAFTRDVLAALPADEAFRKSAPKINVCFRTDSALPQGESRNLSLSPGNSVPVPSEDKTHDDHHHPTGADHARHARGRRAGRCSC